MEIEILHRPSYSLAVARLAPNEKIRAEPGAMVSFSAGIEIETKMEGGLLKSLGRAVLGGESLFQNFWKAGSQGGEVTLAPELPGDIALLTLQGETVMVQIGSFMAAEIGVEVALDVEIERIGLAERFGGGRHRVPASTVAR